MKCELSRFELIQPLTGDQFIFPAAVSGDASVVVGMSYTSSNIPRAFRWENGTAVDLGHLAGDDRAVAVGVSRDGSIVVGRSFNATTITGFRWEGGVMKALPKLDGAGYVIDISADGSTILGFSGDRTVRWRAGAVEDLGLIGTSARMSGNGSTIVGYNSKGPFRWEAGVSVDLAVPSTSRLSCEANDISDDALAIFGSCSGTNEWRSYAWTGSGLKDLGVPPFAPVPPTVQVGKTNRDGSAAVGAALVEIGGDYRAVLWNASGGMRWVSDELASAGIDTGGRPLTEATGVSDDGKTIVGFSVSPGSAVGWVARLP